MSDTPETDAFTTSFTSIDDLKGKKQWVPSDFARKLERERDEAREIIKIVAQDKDKIIEQLIVERDSAREIYKTLHSLYADEIVKNINI